MGICGSAQPSETPRQDGMGTHKGNAEVKVGDIVLDMKPEDVKDFYRIVKDVSLLTLQKLFTALEYEKQGFHELSVKLGLSNMYELVGPEEMENFLQEAFTFSSSVPDPNVPSSDITYDVKRMLLLIEACQRGTWKEEYKADPYKVAKMLKSAAENMQQAMTESAKASESSDLKIHLQFFTKCLDFVEGDITDPDKLEQNIDKIVGADAV